LLCGWREGRQVFNATRSHVWPFRKKRNTENTMFHEPAVQLALLAGIVGLFILTCWHDLATRTLPDWVAVAIAAVGLFWQVASGDLLWSVMAASLVFMGAVFFWYLGALGGGDVKLLGACALLPNASAVPQLLVVMALAGGLLALVYVLGRWLAPAIPPRQRLLPARVWRAETWRLRRGGPLPYALPICLGALFAMMERV
jgi:prepilin peptidase CpaA